MSGQSSDNDPYEPSEEERREIEEILRQEEDRESIFYKIKNRKYYTFHSESHWAGWLKINGIKW